MSKFAVFTDSACDMPLEYLNDNNVHTLFMHYRLDAHEYLDSMTVENSKRFFQAMREGKQPHTVQVTLPEYPKAWQPVYEMGIPIVHITLSSGLSGTYNSGLLARQQFIEEHPDAQIHIVDSLTASQGEGLLVYAAVKLRDEGLSAEECVKWLEDNRLNVNSWFTVEDLNYLKRGGRVSTASAVVGTMLDIKPILSTDCHGHLIPRQKVKGRKRAIKTLAEIAAARMTEQSNEFPFFITHADCYDDASTFADLLRAQGCKDVRLHDMGPIIGTHTGPGLITYFFFGKTTPIE